MSKHEPMVHAYPITENLLAPVNLVAADDESELLRRARARDTAAFEQLYRTHVPRIYAVCLRMTADTHQAEEFTQLAFVAAWQKLAQFRHGSAFGTWLHRIAVNAVLNGLRATARRERRVTTTDDLAAMETPARPAPNGTRLDLEQAIAALPAPARAVFVLYEIEGYGHDEIAALMHVPVGTSKARLHRARQLLQETLR